MPLVPLIGHVALRERLDAQVRRGALPSSLLFTGPAGIGKQRFALWLAQRLLCPEADSPCGRCAHCRYIEGGVHPDLTWVFPRPGMKERDPSPDDVAHAYAEAVAERLEQGGIYARPDGSHGIFVHATRLLVHRATLSPAMARRKVFVVGDAERMVPQSSSQEAANAFLKLLEEPPADTTLLLTSSEPGALLPTIRSRAVAVRMRPLDPAEVREFLALPAAAKLVAGRDVEALVAMSHGAPGALADADAREQALARARDLLAVVHNPERRYRVVYTQGSAKARGAFSDTLDAVTDLLHARVRAAAQSGDQKAAAAHARAMVFVEEAKRDAERNAVPQLVAFRLVHRLGETL